MHVLSQDSNTSPIRLTFVRRILTSDKHRQCFSAYAVNKLVKRMEQMQRETRTSGSKLPLRPQRYLLALSSGGASSTALLNLLHENLTRQQAPQSAKANKGGKGAKGGGQRVRFEIVVAWVDCDLSRPPPVSTDEAAAVAAAETETDADAAWRRYKERYPTFVFHRIPLSSALSLRTNSIDWSSLPPLNADLAANPHEQLADLLYTRLATPSSRADVQRLLVRHLLMDAALREGCDVLLLGTNTTGLAELTLAETAKGRGFSLPWQVNDGPFQVPSFASYLAPSPGRGSEEAPKDTETTDSESPPTSKADGRLFIYHPLRELFRSELQTYVTLTDPPLTNLLSAPSSSTAGGAAVVSHKDLSIDEVMSRYFAEVEINYPSVVANVVRTTGKLERSAGASAHKHAEEDEESTTNAHPRLQQKQCGLCGIVLDEAGDARWRGELGEQAPDVEERRGKLCYGCDRSVNGRS
ncbi:Cytoplasmic tRNA 2-thiolation protein 2 [Apiospora marii]|uniref:Cytoplasmic tRNA 2-thiolation protein 2 n=1 Tax=Apiospora marii TaxID=335849 RepID=UPI00312F548A